ncbi:hypothetical protein, partial [Staphylococcus chromogenes]|uniref:hypothetical protein n=1 Tax=Staphylococcus chromogenes TaxID=46126 RepID=UPI0018E4FB52
MIREKHIHFISEKDIDIKYKRRDNLFVLYRKNGKVISMGLMEKSRVNRDLANEFFHEKKNNDIVANRYYYSCFQKLLHLAQSKYEYSVNKGEGSSHTALINFIEEEINKAMSDEKKRMKLLRAKNIKSNFMNLKNYRVQADYKAES